MGRSLVMNKSLGQVYVLMLANIFAYSTLPMMLFLGSLIGVQLAPDRAWATLPIALLIVGSAVGVIPATQLMKKFGRKPVFLGYSSLGVCACLLAALAVGLRSFFLFGAAACLLGITVAAIQQIRFAAIETVNTERAGTAASIIMCGGIVAALVGPELALRGSMLTGIEYQGAFLLAALGFVFSAAVFALFYRPVAAQQSAINGSGRPLTHILRNPVFLLAVGSSVVGYAVMSFVMTGTPLSMHHHHGHSLADTKWVLQSHMVAMFLPSLIAPWLFARLGTRPLIAIGLLCYLFTAGYGFFDGSVMGFWWQLVALGVGWNFLFVGGTALLPSAYLPGEQFKAQSFHDTTVFSVQAVAALSAGWAVNALSWHWVMVVSLLPIGALAVLLLWERRNAANTLSMVHSNNPVIEK